MGKVNHFEIPAENVAKAKEFYSKTFGWKMMSVPNMDYTMVHTSETDEKGMSREIGVINGGMMPRSDEIRYPVITITVEDIDKAIKDIELHGGRVHVKKMPIPGMGISAYFKDPEGNVMGLFQSTKKI